MKIGISVIDSRGEILLLDLGKDSSSTFKLLVLVGGEGNYVPFYSVLDIILIGSLGIYNFAI